MNRMILAVLFLVQLVSTSIAQVQMDSMSVDTLQSGLDSNGVFFTRSDSESTTSRSSIWSYVDTTGGFGGTADANARFSMSSTGYPNEVAHLELYAGVDIGLTTTAAANASVTFTITEQLVMDIDLVEDSRFDDIEWIIDVTSEQNESFCYRDEPTTLFPGTYTVTLSFDESNPRSYRDDWADATVHLATPVGDQFLTYDNFCPITYSPNQVLPFPGLEGSNLVSDGEFAFQNNAGQSSQIGDEYVRFHGALRIFKDTNGLIEDYGLLLAPNPMEDANFGSSIDAEDGVLVVGASGEGPNREGAVYIYRLIDDQWTFEQRLTSPITENDTRFGRLVGTSNGWLVTTSIVNSGPNPLHVYQYDGKQWQLINSATPTESTYFIQKFTLHNDLLLLSTATFDHQDPQFIGFEMNNNWWSFEEPDFVGENFSGNGPSRLKHNGQWVVASYGGIVRVYRRTQSELMLQEIMQAPAFYCDRYDFPSKISIQNDHIMLSMDDSHPSSNSHLVDAHFIYEFDGESFKPLSKIVEENSGRLVGYSLFNNALIELKPITVRVFSDLQPAIATLNHGTESGYIGSTDLADARFGSSIAIDEADGTMVVGAYGLRTQGTNTGGVWIYEYDQYADFGDYWDEIEEIAPSDLDARDHFGLSVDIDSRICAVGLIGDDSHGTNNGGVHIYQDLNRDNLWSLEMALFPNQPSQYAQFGSYVRFGPAGHNTLLVGSSGYDGQAQNGGAVYLFERGYPEPDFELDWTQTHQILPPDPTEDAYFGVSADWTDSLMVIGAYRDSEVALDAGAVYVYQRFESDWVFVQKLQPPSLSEGSQFGATVKIHEGKIYIGASGDSTDGIRSGALYIYENDMGLWTISDRLYDPNGFDDDAFAQGFDLNEDVLLVGVPGSDSLSVDGGVIVPYTFDGQYWIEQSRDDFAWYSSSAPPPNSRIGSAVTFDGRRAVFGAPTSDLYGDDQGRGVIYYYEYIKCSNGSCRADLTPDGSLDFFDVSAFLQMYSAADSDADFNQDGILDFFDISAFLSAYSEGCP